MEVDKAIVPVANPSACVRMCVTLQAVAAPLQLLWREKDTTACAGRAVVCSVAVLVLQDSDDVHCRPMAAASTSVGGVGPLAARLAVRRVHGRTCPQIVCVCGVGAEEPSSTQQDAAICAPTIGVHVTECGS